MRRREKPRPDAAKKPMTVSCGNYKRPAFLCQAPRHAEMAKFFQKSFEKMQKSP
jgi:hypothetical protein